MEKYNDFLRNITKLIEKGLFASKDIKKDVEETFKSKLENIVNQLNLVSRDEIEVQKKMIKKIEKKFNQYKKK